MSNSVAGRIALGAMVLVVIAVAITSGSAIYRQTEAMEDAENRAADLLSSAIAISSASDIVKDELANLVQTVKRIKEQNPSLIWIAMYDDKNEKLVEYPAAAERKLSANTRQMSRPIQAHGQTFGRIEMIFDISPRDALRRDIITTTLAVSAILLFLALLVSLVWAHFFAKPIVALSNAAESVSKGDLRVQVEVQGRDEIGRLSMRFNEMVGNLARSRAELERTLNELSALYSVSRIINSTSDRSEILRLNIETLSTGFAFSPVVILLQLQHKWRVAAVKAGGAEVVPSFPLNEVSLNGLGVDPALFETSYADIDGAKLPKDWGFGAGYSGKVFGVPLKSGSHLVGLLIAGGRGAAETDAGQILSVVASQISPPILVSIMTEREMSKLSNPFAYISGRIDDSIGNARKFGVELSVIAFGFTESAWKAGATAVEKRFQQLERELKGKIAEADLIVRYGVNCVIVVVPSWSTLDSRKAIMTLDLKDADDLESEIVAMPEDGACAADILSRLEAKLRG